MQNHMKKIHGNNGINKEAEEVKNKKGKQWNRY